MRGYCWGIISILLVTAAQLMMCWAMIHLPPMGELGLFFSALWQREPFVLGLWGGLLAYGLSMLCWVFALQRLPLSIAYPMLSLSYILVWGIALWLPGFNETFSQGKLLGIGLVVMGLLLIYLPNKKNA